VSERRFIAAELDPPVCPFCEKTLNALCGDSLPDDGDFAFCVYCLKMSIFSIHPTSVTLRAPSTKEEKAECEEARRELIDSD